MVLNVLFTRKNCRFNMNEASTRCIVSFCAVLSAFRLLRDTKLINGATKASQLGTLVTDAL